jgi:hypothetical protein
MCIAQPQMNPKELSVQFTLAPQRPKWELLDIYKERWQIELFFKWIKQNLKIKTFLGTSSNAVLTQVWIALCVYLLVAYLNFKAKLGSSMQHILRVLQLNLFARRNLIEMFKPPATQHLVSPQILLWKNL